MPVDSWTLPEETPALAASASAMIDAALTGTGLSRETYWAAVRKGYNTPYNDPPRKCPAAAPVAAPVAIELVEAAPTTLSLPVAVMAAHNAAAEIHAG